MTDDVVNAANDLKKYLDNLGTQNVNVYTIKDELITLSKSNLNLKNAISDLLMSIQDTETYLNAVKNRLDEIPGTQLRSMPLDQVEDEIKRAIFKVMLQGYPPNAGPSPNMIQFVDLLVTKKFVEKMLTTRFIDEVVVKNYKAFETWGNKGLQIQRQAKANLEALVKSKSTGGNLLIREVEKLQIQIKSDLRALYLFRRELYDQIIKELNTLKSGATSVENAKLYDDVITDIKANYGDWTVLEKLAQNKKLGWAKILWEGVKDVFKLETELAGAIKGFPKFVRTIGKNADNVTNATKEGLPSAWKEVGKTLVTGSPKGFPRSLTSGPNPYQAIIDSKSMYGAYASYATTLLLRAFKVAIYLSIYNSFRKMIVGADSDVLNKFGQEGKSCMDKLSKEISSKNLNFISAEKYLNDGNLPCIYNLKMTDTDFTNFIMAAQFRTGADPILFLPTTFWNDLSNRLSNDPFIAVPIPAAQILANLRTIWKDGFQEWLNNEIGDIRLPDAYEPRTVGPVKNTGTVGPVKKTGSVKSKGK
jgi:hypothetical protein